MEDFGKVTLWNTDSPLKCMASLFRAAFPKAMVSNWGMDMVYLYPWSEDLVFIAMRPKFGFSNKLLQWLNGPGPGHRCGVAWQHHIRPVKEVGLTSNAPHSPQGNEAGDQLLLCPVLCPGPHHVHVLLMHKHYIISPNAKYSLSENYAGF